MSLKIVFAVSRFKNDDGLPVSTKILIKVFPARKIASSVFKFPVLSEASLRWFTSITPECLSETSVGQSMTPAFELTASTASV